MRIPQRMSDPGFPGGLPPAPVHRFVGREAELQALQEKLTQFPLLLLHGFAGSGKTSLAVEAARRSFQSGQFPGGAVFIPLDEGIWLAQLCRLMARALTDDAHFTFGPEVSAAQQIEAVGQMLQEQPTLVILDSFHVQSTRPGAWAAGEYQSVLDAIWNWRQPAGKPGSRILLTAAVAKLNDSRFASSSECAHLELAGMVPAELPMMLSALLEFHQIDQSAFDETGLLEIAQGLGGHPLSLVALLPLLSRLSIADLREGLQAIMPGFAYGAAESASGSLSVALDFLLSQLGEEALTLVPALTVFRGGTMEAELLAITRYESAFWTLLRVTLERSGLLLAQTLPNVGPPFIRFHAALSWYLATRATPDLLREVDERYWRRYLSLARHLYREDAHHPQQTRTIAIHELPNFYRALSVLMAKGDMESTVILGQHISGFLHVFGRELERQQLLEKVPELGGSAELAPDGDSAAAEETAADSRVSELPGWAPSFINAVVEAVAGDAAAGAVVSELLPQLEEDGWQGGDAVLRIWNGERDEAALCEDLSAAEAELIRQVLGLIAAGAADGEEAAGEAALAEPDSESVETGSDEIEDIRRQWDLVIQTMIAACQGDDLAAEELPPVLEQLSESEDWQQLADVLGRILAGARSAAVLSGLDAIDRLIAGDILKALDVDIETAASITLPQSDRLRELSTKPLVDSHTEPGEAMTLDNLFSLVVLARSPEAPAGLAEQLDAATRGLAEDDSASEEIRELGNILNRVLAGDHHPDLSSLPLNLQNITRTMLATLR